ncbi:MAG: GntR family transcriptional regulator, partial [Bacilli bacterium]|nr:GntR family transcriptional regulator [Bacilli bacterium]
MAEECHVKILKSESISEDLRNRIYSGEFNATHRLPSENDLSAYYGCSRPTLRKALDSLESSHL